MTFRGVAFSALLIYLIFVIYYSIDFFYAVFGVFWVMVLSSVVSTPIVSLLTKRWDRKTRLENDWSKTAIENYLKAVSSWEYHQKETGFGFWKDQKGAEFEISVAQLFAKRGWSAELTSQTGDGGVDVVLHSGSQLYWCQCKGHHKPIPVDEVRRIAGVAIKGEGRVKPVLISTNGFTGPALTEATELGVICLDGLNLTQLAQMERIPELD